MSARRWLATMLVVPTALAAAMVATAWAREAWLASRPLAPSTLSSQPAQPAQPAQPVDATVLARGAYLARIGNCAGCHTARGGPAMAGGVPLATPFGTLYSSNLTPDPDTGLGRWSADDFWRALHLGRSRDGRLLYPAFPYTSFTGMTRADSDALYVWLRQLPARRGEVPAHSLGLLTGWQTSLAVWRLWNFVPMDGASSAADRGRYLVEVVGHCAECHAPRNRVGALRDAPGLGGGWVGIGEWWAPSLADPAEGGVQSWSDAEVREWLTSGWSSRGVALGPMADVVADSLRHLAPSDARAMAQHLRSLPVVAGKRGPVKPAPSPQIELGRRVYATHCIDCHGDRGQGRSVDGQPVYPALAGNRAVTQASARNLLQVLANGAYAAATPGHPRPYGMPPMRQVLSAAEMAAVASMVRQSWGNEASAVTEQDVLRLR